MIEYDFLTAFEEELQREADVSHKLEGEERQVFLHAMGTIQHQTEVRHQLVTTMRNPKKEAMFQELLPELIHLARENCV